MDVVRFCFKSIPYVALVVAIFTFVRTCGLRVRAQAIWIMVLTACLSKFLCFDALGGNAFHPDFPDKLIWFWNFAYSGAVLLTAFSVPVVWWRSKAKTWLLPTVAWSLSAVGLWNGLKPPAVREIELAYADLPPALDGYRIVQLSDLHVSSSARRWRTQRVVDMANALDADLVCLTGDYVDGSPKRLAEDLEPICGLKAKDGVWAVRGNHECFRHHFVWQAWYDRCGIRFLENDCVFPRRELALGGVNDFRIQDPETGALYGIYPNVGETFAAATNGEFRVLLQHQPRQAHANLVGHGVRLQLSGHTHGGIMPGLRELISRFNDGFVCGLYRIGESFLYVNPGCGQWAGFPIRLFDPSEVTVIRLRRGR